MADFNRRPKLPRQNDLICAGTLSAHGAAIAEQNGGYLESYLSLPGLTRASAALTCSCTAFA
jgi:hypothetical protein